MFGLIVGAIVGGAAVWFWKEDIRQTLDRRTHAWRAKAADGLEVAEKKAEDLLERAKPQIVRTIRAGRDAIRPTGEGPVDRVG